MASWHHGLSQVRTSVGLSSTSKASGAFCHTLDPAHSLDNYPLHLSRELPVVKLETMANAVAWLKSGWGGSADSGGGDHGIPDGYSALLGAVRHRLQIQLSKHADRVETV